MKPLPLSLFSGQAVRSVVLGLLIWLALHQGRDQIAKKLADRI